MLPDTAIPIRVTVNRLTNHRDYFRGKLRELPWWAWKRRRTFASAAAVYDYEIDSLLELGGKHVLERILSLK